MQRLFRKASLFLIPLALVLFFGIAVNYLLEHKDEIFKTSSTITPAEPPREQVVPVVSKEAKPPQRTQAEEINPSIPSVIIDPAHGGDDTGFVGYHGAVEAQANLQFSFMLARELRMKGIRVYLTRTEDKSVPLAKRIAYSEQLRPLLYLSVNCAFSGIKTIEGIELFAFTPEQKGDEFENAENGYYEAYEGRYLPKSEDAMVLEQRIARGLKKALDLPYKSGLERRFLKQLSIDPQTAGLSIFIGYISNIDDVKKLSNSKFMEKTAQVMAGSIEKSLSLSVQDR